MNILSDLLFCALIVTLIYGSVKIFREELKTYKARKHLLDLETKFYEVVPKYLKAIVSFHGCTFSKCQICNVTDCETGKIAREQGDVAYYEFLANVARMEHDLE